MIPALKAELRKLLSVRSTYVIVGLTLFVTMFFAGFVQGYNLDGAELTHGTSILQSSIQIGAMSTAIFGAMVAILLFSHEYRYNTILYSLTANKSRSVFLFAKVLIISVFALLLTAMVAVTAPFFTLIGVHLAGNALAPQHIFYHDIAWQVLFYGWGYSIISLLLAVLIRNQIGTIVTLFVVPATVESLLSVWLKDNTAYLPFSALGAVLERNFVLSSVQSAGVFLIYLVVGWAIAWVLFLKRDAN